MNAFRRLARLFRRAPAPKPTFRPRLEAVEERLAPATFTVTNGSNAGVGSLRAAIISANGTAGADVINFNIAGAGARKISLAAALPAITEQVTIDATTQPGFTNVPLIVLTGSNAGATANGFVLAAGADNCVIKGLVINDFNRSGIVIKSDGNAVNGCYIGTNATGSKAIPNTLDGIQLSGGASGNTIGGTNGGNFIAGNGRFGVNISGVGTDANTVARSTIGSNEGTGIQIAGGAKNNIIGGTEAGLGCVISANGVHGLVITGAGTTGNLVQGNFIGTNVDGTAKLGNVKDGVVVSGGATGNFIGVVAAGNLISGNGRLGVNVTGAGTSGNIVSGNLIGMSVNGTALGNTSAGVQVTNGADGNTIGGTVAGASNAISGNRGAGIFISAADNTLIQGNRIGTLPDGSGSLPNGSHGIFVTGAAANTTVGGTATGAGNLIRNNAGHGVLIGRDPAHGLSSAVGLGNSILGNSIFNNTLLGIKLAPNPGTLIPVFPPTIQSATIVNGGTQIQVNVSLTGSPNTTYRLEVFVSTAADASGSGEGQAVLGSIDVTTNASGAGTGSGTFAYAATAGNRITTTATNLTTDNTSEFSVAFTAS